jgi:DNA-binding NtrC family response regulator
MISGKGSIETAVKATKLGAINFIEKSLVTKEKIKNVLESAITNNDKNVNKDLLKFLQQNGIIGSSKEVLELGDKIIKFGRTDLNILITGETGTGKKLVANAIHNISKRAKQTMVTVDIPNIPRELFQSELFGHVKGAFSGAIDTKKGLFQQANKSTLFLDEIGDLSSELQANLLIPIESKIVRKVGSVEPELVDLRIVSATDKDLLKAMREDKFREQLYHRLRECEISIPPLRDRREDIPEIINYYLSLHNDKYTDLKTLSPSCYDYLLGLEWKGNIRELAGVVKVVLQTTPSEIVEVQDFNKVIQTVIYSKSEVLIPKVIETKSTNIAEITNIDTNTTLKEDLALVDKKKIESTLAKCKGNVSKTAASLGVSRETLHNKIRKYDINIKDYRVRDN